MPTFEVNINPPGEETFDENAEKATKEVEQCLLGIANNSIVQLLVNDTNGVLQFDCSDETTCQVVQKALKDCTRVDILSVCTGDSRIRFHSIIRQKP